MIGCLANRLLLVTIDLFSDSDEVLVVNIWPSDNTDHDTEEIIAHTSQLYTLNLMVFINSHVTITYAFTSPVIVLRTCTCELSTSTTTQVRMCVAVEEYYNVFYVVRIVAIVLQ